MPESTFEHPLFGHIRFRTNSSEWKRGDKIKFISGFDLEDVSPIFIPQLKNIHGANNGKLKFHKRGHQQLLTVFKEIEEEGYFIT